MNYLGFGEVKNDILNWFFRFFSGIYILLFFLKIIYLFKKEDRILEGRMRILNLINFRRYGYEIKIG